MFNPELTNRTVLMGQGPTVICLRVTEKCWVEVQADTDGLCPIHPARKVFNVDRISVDLAAAEIPIAGVEIEAVCTRDKSVSDFEIGS